MKYRYMHIYISPSQCFFQLARFFVRSHTSSHSDNDLPLIITNNSTRDVMFETAKVNLLVVTDNQSSSK